MKTIIAHVDMVSGTFSSSTTMNTFVSQYPNGHKFYGFMDYLINFQLQTINHGITGSYLRKTIKPTESLSTTVTLHHFITQQQFSLTENKKDLGQELDIISNYKYNRTVSFELGLASFLPNTLMRTAFNTSDISYWTYLTTQIGC